MAATELRGASRYLEREPASDGPVSTGGGWETSCHSVTGHAVAKSDVPIRLPRDIEPFGVAVALRDELCGYLAAGTSMA